MRRASKYLVAMLIVLLGVYLLGWIAGDNETGIPAGSAAVYLIAASIFFYHYFRNRHIRNL